MGGTVRVSRICVGFGAGDGVALLIATFLIAGTTSVTSRNSKTSRASRSKSGRADDGALIPLPSAEWLC
eukprot:3992362-Amphidinium_carterae.1